MIDQLPKGALRDPVDERDFKLERVMGAPIVDFSKGGDRWQKITFWREQWASLSCTGQATAYVVDITNNYPTDPTSAKSIYPFVRLPQGGAYIRDAVLRAINPGVATQSEVPDPDHATEADYTGTASINPLFFVDGKQRDAWVMPDKSIDYVAWGILNYKAVVFGLEGTNPGWKDLSNPKPPGNEHDTIWGHALAAVDYHVHDGKKCIIAASSWTKTGGVKIHHINEDYFNSGSTFNPWVIIPRGEVSMAKVLNDNGTVSIQFGKPGKEVYLSIGGGAETGKIFKAILDSGEDITSGTPAGKRLGVVEDGPIVDLD
jgi:hypothetical protein